LSRSARYRRSQAAGDLGKDNDNGARLAIDEANARGVTLGGQKVKFMLLSEDDQADPKTATIVAQKLWMRRSRALIGHLNSGASIPASKIYYDAGIPQISPSPRLSSTPTRASDCVSHHDQRPPAGPGARRIPVRKMGGKRVAIVDDRTAMVRDWRTRSRRP